MIDRRAACVHFYAPPGPVRRQQPQTHHRAIFSESQVADAHPVCPAIGYNREWFPEPPFSPGKKIAMFAADSTSADPAGFPESLRSLFWDCDFDALDWQQHRDFVIGRVLVAGSWDAICWVRRTVGDDALREWIQRRQGRSLSPQQLRYWELVLELPAELVDAWLESEERQIWEGRLRR
jgi:hypothetical protein